MARDPTSGPKLSPYEKRLQATDRKLREALDRLVCRTPSDASFQDQRYPLSVASLAREAGVARNTIYTNHRAMIDDLRQAARLQSVPSKLETWQDKLAQQRAAIDLLKAEQRRLVTENAALLKRAIDAEALAERHQRQHARLLERWTKERSPVSLAPLTSHVEIMMRGTIAWVSQQALLMASQ